MASKKKKVLVVDDEYSSRRLVTKILHNNFDCDVLQAEEGSVALQIMVNENLDLVILDLVMPFMNGVKVLQTMRQSQALKDVPVIVCTSVGDQSAVQKVLKFGVADYLVKPVDEASTVEKLSSALEPSCNPDTH